MSNINSTVLRAVVAFATKGLIRLLKDRLFKRASGSVGGESSHALVILQTPWEVLPFSFKFDWLADFPAVPPDKWDAPMAHQLLTEKMERLDELRWFLEFPHGPVKPSAKASPQDAQHGHDGS